MPQRLYAPLYMMLAMFSLTMLTIFTLDGRVFLNLELLEMIAIIFSLFFIVKLLPDGLLQIILFSFTYTFVLFLTYSILGRKRNQKN